MSDGEKKVEILRIPNATSVLVKMVAIGEALNEMCIHTRGTARREVLKDRVMALAAEVAEISYTEGGSPKVTSDESG